MKILVAYYSQTGQLKSILDSILSEIKEDVEVSYLEIKMATTYPFPWTAVEFFDTFPETVYGIPQEITTSTLAKDESFDLIILGYQTWYMSPSIPMNSFLASDQAKRLLKDKPVITVIGSRNMWMVGQEKVKQKLIDLNAFLVGNIAMVDKTPNLIGIITILGWMLKGVKKNLFGFLPESGVAEKDVSEASRFGPVILNHLKNEQLDLLQSKLNEQGAVDVAPKLLFLEKRADRLFKIYAKFMIVKGGPRNPKRKFRAKLLLIGIPLGALILSPILALLSIVTLIINRKKIKEIKRQYALNEITSV